MKQQMSKKSCPLCGGKVLVEDVFCKKCQDTANKSSIEGRLKPSTSSSQNVYTANKTDCKPVSDSANAMPSTIHKVKEDNKRNNKKRNVFLIILSLLCIALALVGAIWIYWDGEQKEIEEKTWTNCIDTNTSIVYAQYLQQYPRGEYSLLAEQRIRELNNLEQQTWNDLKSTNDLNKYFSYLEDYPNTPHVVEVKNRIDHIAWESALNENTADAYRAYIENIELGNYIGAYKTIAMQKFEYLNNLTVLEGAERNSILQQVEKIMGAIGKHNTEQLSTLMSDSLANIPRLTHWAKNNMLDFLRGIYDKKQANALQLNYKVLTDRTNVLKDIDSLYFINTTVVEKIISKDKKLKTSIDTIRIKLQLDKNRKLMSIEKGEH